MSNPIQTLELVDDRFGALIQVEKTSTVRWNENPINEGLMLYRSSSQKYFAVVYVTKVHHIALGNVMEIVGPDDHTPDNETMLRQMQRHYPDITLNTPVELIEHLSVSKTAQKYSKEVVKIIEELLPPHELNCPSYDMSFCVDDSLRFVKSKRNAIYQQLRKKYAIEDLIEGIEDEVEQVKRVVEWVSLLWEHDGLCEPSAKNSLAILREVFEENKAFRCVEYSIVCEDVLGALGFAVRQLSLRTCDVATRMYSAGHVANEVWLPQTQRWMFIDSQVGACARRKDGSPLNAVELSKALWGGCEVCLLDKKNSSYICFLKPYLFYMLTLMQGDAQSKRVLLMPQGASIPEAFQVFHPFSYDMAITSVKTFYQAPL